MKLLKEKLEFGNDFIDMTPKKWPTKETNELEFIKVKNFYA